MKRLAYCSNPLRHSSRTIALGLVGELQSSAPWGGYFLLSDSSHAKLRSEFEKIRPDAFVVHEAFSPHVSAIINEVSIPTVLIRRNLDGARAIPVIRHDQHSIGRMAAEYLLEQKFRNIAIVYYEGTEGPRIHAFLDTVKRRGIEASVFELSAARLGENPYTPMTTPRGLIQWLRGLPRPCAIFAHSDRTGAHLIRLCNLHGIRVPEDLAILGADDDDLLCHTVSPNLASVHLPWTRLGAEAAHLILDWREERRVIEFPPTAVTDRESVRQQIRPDHLVLRALEHLRESRGKVVRVSDLQKLTGTNAQQLVYRFRAATGRTPMEEILRHRIDYAKLLLADTDEPTGNIARQCGFNSSNRFYVTFQKEVHMSPGEYRSQFRK